MPALQTAADRGIGGIGGCDAVVALDLLTVQVCTAMHGFHVVRDVGRSRAGWTAAGYQPVTDFKRTTAQ